MLQAGEAGDHLQSPRARAAGAGAEVRGPLSWRMVCLENANCWPTGSGRLREVCFGPKEIFFFFNLNDC